jgi:hypothetical protein
MSENRSLAVLEILVHLSDVLPDKYVPGSADLPDDVSPGDSATILSPLVLLKDGQKLDAVLSVAAKIASQTGRDGVIPLR